MGKGSYALNVVSVIVGEPIVHCITNSIVGIHAAEHDRKVEGKERENIGLTSTVKNSGSGTGHHGLLPSENDPPG